MSGAFSSVEILWQHAVNTLTQLLSRHVLLPLTAEGSPAPTELLCLPDRETAVRGALNLIRKVRKHNPRAKIVWILPSSDCRPELAAEAVRRAREETEEVYAFTLPDYGPEDAGARWHPNADYNRRAGLLLGEFLGRILKAE